MDGKQKFKWYSAHVIMYTRFKDGTQEKYPIWENVFLVKADSSETAHQKVVGLARDEEGDSSGTYTYEDRPAEWVFAGVRKIVECCESGSPPEDGVELTYSVFEVEDKESLEKLVNGEPVKVLYDE